MKKKICSYLLSFVLILSIVPLTAFAGGATTDNGVCGWVRDYIKGHPFVEGGSDGLIDYLGDSVNYTVSSIGNFFFGAEREYYTGPSSAVGDYSTNINANYVNSGNTSSNVAYINNNQFIYQNNQYDITNINYNSTYNVYNVQTTNNYNYFVTYAPTYINITYLDSGGTMQTTNYYYMLPDGRNSFDLTAEDVWGTYFNYDVGNYELVVEDNNTLGLYHFDSNLKDVSAYTNSLSWVEGASNNYNQHDGYGSALYMPGGVQNYFQFGGALENAKTSEFMMYLGGYDGANYSVLNNSFSYFGKSSITDSNPTLTDVFGASRMKNIAYHKISESMVNNGNDSTYIYYSYSAVYRVAEVVRITYKVGGYSYLPVVVVSTVSISGTIKSDYMSAPFFIGDFVMGTESYQSYIFCEMPSFSSSGVLQGQYISAGSWHHIAVSNGSLFLYGLKISSPYKTSTNTNWFISSNYLGSYCLIDELRFSNTVYTSNYTPLHQPFDTNKILVVPDDGEDGQIIVKSSIPVTAYRIGGVRPSNPAIGNVYISVENNKVTGIQQYQTGGWEPLDGAIYKDGWQNLSKYDLSDYVIDEGNTPDPGGTTDPTDPGGNDGDDEDGLFDKILGFLGSIFGFLGKIVGMLVDGLKTLVTSILGLFDSMLDFVTGFGSFLAAAFVFIPSEIISLIVLGLSLSIVLMFIKFFRG